MMPSRKKPLRLWCAILASPLVLVLGGCARSSGSAAGTSAATVTPTLPAPGIDGQAFGGTGRLETARQILTATFQRYKANGVPPTFGRYYAGCLTTHSALPCGRLRDHGDDTSKIGALSRFVNENIEEILHRIAVTPFLAKDPQKVAAPDQNGALQQVDAMVPVGLDEAWFSTKFLGPETDDEEVTAAAAHEVMHLLQRGGRGRLTDWQSLDGYGLVMTAFNAIGASIVADPFAQPNHYRDAVLRDLPLAYFPLDDFQGSRLAWNSVPGGAHGRVNGNVRYEQASETSSSGYALLLDSTDASPGSLTLDLSGFGKSLGPSVTAELWVKWTGTDANGSTTGTTLFGFGNYSLVTWLGLLGFNSAQSDLFGVEAGPSFGGVDHPASLTGKWVHVAAKMVDGDPTSNAIYLNGIRQITANQQIPAANPAAAALSTIVNLGGAAGNGFHGWDGQLSDLAIYSGELPEDRIKFHYAQASAARSVASATLTLGAGVTASDVVHVSLPDCPKPQVIASSRVTSLLCGNTAGQSLCANTPGWTSTPLRTSVRNLSSQGFDLQLLSRDPIWVEGGSRQIVVDYQFSCR